MSDNVVQFPIVPRPQPYEPHMSLLERLKKTREESKARVQQMAEQFRQDAWRADKYADAKLFVDRVVFHPLGGKEWALQILDDLKHYVEGR